MFTRVQHALKRVTGRHVQLTVDVQDALQKVVALPIWRKLPELLCSITPAVAGSRGMFTRVQHALKRVAGRHVQLTADVHYELEAWRKIVRSLASRTTHLRKL